LVCQTDLANGLTDSRLTQMGSLAKPARRRQSSTAIELLGFPAKGCHDCRVPQTLGTYNGTVWRPLFNFSSREVFSTSNCGMRELFCVPVLSVEANHSVLKSIPIGLGAGTPSDWQGCSKAAGCAVAKRLPSRVRGYRHG
jgi:hypothetical protein